MRAFVGVPLPPLEDVVRLLDQLRECGADLKVVRADQLHLTLKFLGDVDDRLVARLEAAVRAITFPPTFSLEVQDVGSFPDERKLNVLWAGIRDPSGSFGRAFTLVEQALGPLGFPPEGRSFHPHLTLARKRTDRGRERARAVLDQWRGHRFGQARVEAVRLYRSTLTPQGPVYEPLAEVALT